MVQRMTAILDTFDSSSRRRSLQDISDLSGLPRSTAHRILEQLLDLGWVAHSASGYRLGWRALHRIGDLAGYASLREVAAPYIHEMSLHTPFIVHLAVLDGPFVRYLDKVGGPRSASVPSRVGGLLPAHLTAVGKAMLAHVEAESLDIALDHLRVLERLDEDDVVAIHNELAAIRLHGGLATESSSQLAPVACIGAPIFGTDGQVVGGLSLCDGGSARPLDRFARPLLERAKRISNRMILIADEQSSWSR
jgi:DNA-binding IclR family transcriptional regulator